LIILRKKLGDILVVLQQQLRTCEGKVSSGEYNKQKNMY